MAESREYRARFWTLSGVGVVILLLILLILSFFGDRFSRFKIDLTDDGVYTLSEPFQRLLENLEDTVTIRYYVSEELPGYFMNLPRDTVDMFDEIRSLSPMVEYRVIDPEKEAARVAREKVEKYKKAEADEESLDELEPKPQESIQDLFRGGFGAKKKTPAEIRDLRRKKAAAYAEKTGRTADDERYELLDQEYRQVYLDTLMEEGILPVRYRDQSGSEVRDAMFYSALEIRYQDREAEVVPRHLQIDRLELELAQRILKLAVPSKPKVAFFDGRAPEDVPPPNPLNPQPQAPRSDYQQVTNYLREFFDVRTVSLKEGDSIDDLEKNLLEEVKRDREERGLETDEGLEEEAAISCFVVAQPDNLESRQVYEIARAISRGIPTILLVSRHSIDASGGSRSGYPITFVNPGAEFEDMLRAYGIEIGRGILGSNEQGRFPALVNVLGMAAEMPIPFYCLPVAAAQEQRLDQDHYLLNRINALCFPATNGLTVDTETLEKHGLKIERLAWTSPETWAVENVLPFSRSPFGQGAQPTTLFQNHLDDLVQDQKRPRKTESEDFSFIDRRELAVLIRGSMPFVYQGKEIPEWKKEEKTENDEDADGPVGSGGPAGPQDEDAEPGAAAAETGPEAPAAAPADEGEVEAPDAPEAVDTSEAQPAEKPRADLTPAADCTLLVVASVDALKDTFLVTANNHRIGELQSNLAFFQNTLETFGLGRDLLEIRGKGITRRYFERDTTEGKQVFIQVLNIGLIPLAVIVIGLIRYLMRRAEAAAYERQMASGVK